MGKFPIPNTKVTGELYASNNTVGTKKNEYYFYLDSTTNNPMFFYFKGYDELMGSHYDQYVFTYTTVEVNFDDSVFDIYNSE